MNYFIVLNPPSLIFKFKFMLLLLTLKIGLVMLPLII